MNKYRRLLGTSRGGHFKEPRRKLKFSPSRRRQSIPLRGRYAKSLLQRMGNFLGALLKIVLIGGATAWLISFGVHFFRETDFLNLKSVIFSGAVPETLPNFLPIKSGQNIFSLKISEWEKRALDKYPEIEEISIRRSLTRNVVVDVTLRTPLAYNKENGTIKGVDKSGILFPLKASSLSEGDLGPFVTAGSNKARQSIVQFIISLKSKFPELAEKFDSLSMRDVWLEVTLNDGIVLEWGVVDEKNIFDKAKNILRLLSEYSPTKIPAKLSFVTPERIVMDANWAAKSSK